MRKHTPLIERFWSKVQKTSEDGCWLWTGQRLGSRAKYGEIPFGASAKTKHLTAHRLAFKIAYGPFDERFCVLHRCDVPLCVNPSHLFLGTVADNNADMSRKLRHGRSKLNPEQIKEIFKQRANGVLVRKIAEKFSVSNFAIYSILNRKRYKYVEIV